MLRMSGSTGKVSGHVYSHGSHRISGNNFSQVKVYSRFPGQKNRLKKQDGRPEAGVFHHGSQIRSTDSYERPKPVDYDASKKLVL